MSSTLIGTIYEFDENRATVNDVIEHLNRSTVLYSYNPLGDVAVNESLKVNYGVKVVSMIKPTIEIYNHFVSQGLMEDCFLIEDGSQDDMGANVFSYKGESYLILFYNNVKGEDSYKLFSTDKV